MLAFELADRYRNPAMVVADGYIGQMVEPVEFPARVAPLTEKPWAVSATAATRPNVITSIHLDPDLLEAHNRKLQEKYRQAERAEQRSEGYRLDDAEEIFVAYGIVARVLRTTVDQAREQGIRAGLLRPITLWPFPVDAIEKLVPQARAFHAVELSDGQMVRDVRLALDGRRPTTFYGRSGGVVPSSEELLEVLKRNLEVHRHGAARVR
jgi:pyruvate/2-oxoacid:ferredoxin oxidoreductase alpha subunit